MSLELKEIPLWFWACFKVIEVVRLGWQTMLTQFELLWTLAEMWDCIASRLWFSPDCYIVCNFMVDSYSDKDVVAYFLLPACLSTAGFNYLIHDYLQKNPMCFLTFYNSAIWQKNIIAHWYCIPIFKRLFNESKKFLSKSKKMIKGK